MSKRPIRIRYGRVNGGPKNTLVTTQSGDTIYFGIARCNLVLNDVFKRSGLNGGRTIATRRLERILEEGDIPSYKKIGNIMVHPKGLRGFVSRENVKELISFFNNIDEWSRERFAPLAKIRYSEHIEAA